MDIETLEKFNEWKTRSLEPLVEELRADVETLRNLPSLAFNAAVTKQARKASDAFLATFGLSSVADIPRDLGATYSMALVAALNSALPHDFPFIIALVHIDSSPETKLGVLDRKKIPGIEEVTKQNIVPVIRLSSKNGEPIDPTKPILVHVRSAKYIGGDENSRPDSYIAAEDIE